jgi:hypothetical protein
VAQELMNSFSLVLRRPSNNHTPQRIFMNLMKKTVLVLTVGAFSSGLIGCTEEQVNIGTGIAIGAIIGASLADDSSHHHHYDRPAPRPYRPGYGPGRGRGYRTISAVATPISAEQEAAQNMVEKYDLTWEAASVLATPLVSAKKGNIEALSQLGITREDMLLMSEGKNPSATTLTVLSEKLALSLGETHTLIQQMKTDVQAALAAQ